MNAENLSRLFGPALTSDKQSMGQIHIIKGILTNLDPNMDDEARLRVGRAIHKAMEGAGGYLWNAWLSEGGRGCWSVDEIADIWIGFGDTFTDAEPEKSLSVTIPVPAHRFLLISVSDFIKRPAPTWLVKGLLPAKGIAMVYGPSGAGKTFWVLDVMMAIAQGKAWRKHRVKGGRVVYVAAEGADGLVKRCKAMAQQFGVKLDDVELRLIPDTPNLFSGGDAAGLIQSIMDAGGAAVVVIDTLAQTTAGANENAGEDMGKVFETLQTMQRALDCLVLLVHHAGKDSSKGARGWSGMRAALDAEIEVTKTPTGHMAKVTKQKDGADGAVYPFKLLPVTLGWDEDGDAVDSCVVEHVEETPKREAPKGKLQKQIWEAILAGDVQTVDDIPAALEGLYAKGKVPRGDSIQRAIEAMVERGFIRVEAGIISLPQSHNSPQ